MAQRLKTLRRKGSKGAPSAFELVNLSNQSQQLRCDVNGVRLDHTRIYTGLYRIIHLNNDLILPE
jgi:hypothetical protein